MSHAGTAARSHVERHHRGWLEPLARAGYAARGVVYLLVGGLALLAAIGQGGQTTGSRGALQNLAGQSWGQIALGAIAIGLLGHALWRFIQGALDADDHGAEAKGVVIRAGLVGSGITYVLLALYAGSLVIGGLSSSGGGGGSKDATSWLMSKPFGIWLVGIAGAIIIGIGFAQVIKGGKAKFEKWLKLSQSRLKKVSPVCRFGLIARGVTFWIIGGFVIVAAVQADPSEARGLGGALSTLREQAYGPWLLGVVALGLLAFSAYSFIEAAYRKVSMV